MRNLKKVLSLSLAFVMLLGMMVVGGSAAAYNDSEDISYATAADVLSAIGVFNGDENGDFNPTGDLTREQAAKIITYMMMTKTNADKLGTTTAPFSDVAADRWSAGSIAYCVSMGIVAGNGDGTFDPTANVTGYAFAKMLLTALGYDASIEGYVGSSWAANVNKDALTNGLLNGLDIALAANLTREQAAQMAFNTLTANVVDYDGGIEVTNSDGTKITIGAEIVEFTDVNAYSTSDTAGRLQFCEKYFPTLKMAVRTDDYGYATQNWFIGNNASDMTWAANKEVAVADTANVLVTYTTVRGPAISEGDLYKDLGMAIASLPLSENGNANGNVASTKGSMTPVFTAKGAKMDIVDNNGDGNADAALVTYAYVAEVASVVDATPTTDRAVVLNIYNTATPVSVSYETEEFEKGDYVLVYLDETMTTTAGWTTAAQFANKILDVEAADETVVGKVTKVTGTNSSSVEKLTIGGTDYEVAATTLAGLGLGGNTVAASTFGYTSEYTLIMNNGYIVAALGQAAVANINKIVYVTTAEWSSTDDYGTTVYNVQTVALDGTVTVYTTAINPSGLSAGFYEIGTGAGGQKTFTPVANEATTSVIDGTTTFFADAELAAALSMTDKTTSVAIATSGDTALGRAYITDSTRLIFANGTKATLKTSVSYGAMKQSFADNSLVLLSKTIDGNYEVEAIISTAAQVNVSGDVVYILGSDVVGEIPVGGGSKSTATMYDLAGNESDVPTDETGDMFATYETDKDGVYSFTAVSDAAVANGDGVYYAINGELSLYNGLLTLVDADDEDFTDLDATGAVVINTATPNALALKDLVSAATLAASILVVDGAVVTIVVTAYSAS